MTTVQLHHGDCLDVLRTFPDNSVDSIVTDPPYGLGFMGRAWDSLPPGREWATECLRVLKPGGHLLAFGGTRTWHRLACAIEDAGFEVRDSIAWMYGSGFPKSLDVSKAIDKAAGVEREVVGERSYGDGHVQRSTAPRFNGTDYANGEVYVEPNVRTLTAPATNAACQWQGWGTALKPAHEPIVVARKPLTGTVAANVLAHGTGALNIDGCRVALLPGEAPAGSGNQHGGTWDRQDGGMFDKGRSHPSVTPAAGRWPANVVLDESQAAALDQQSGRVNDSHDDARNLGRLKPQGEVAAPMDSGGASRFFYVAKADASERVRVNGTAHPTVKPVALMRWLVRLVTPPGGTVLEPFAGSGTTVEACILEGFNCIAIEREADYLPLIQQRIDRRRHPVAAVLATEDDAGLFDLLDPPNVSLTSDTNTPKRVTPQ